MSSLKQRQIFHLNEWECPSQILSSIQAERTCLPLLAPRHRSILSHMTRLQTASQNPAGIQWKNFLHFSTRTHDPGQQGVVGIFSLSPSASGSEDVGEAVVDLGSRQRAAKGYDATRRKAWGAREKTWLPHEGSTFNIVPCRPIIF